MSLHPIPERSLKACETGKKLGGMLLEAGLMTEFQLNQAVLNQGKSRLRLGQYLIREGVVSESQIVDLISRQLRIAKYDAARYPSMSP